MIFAQTNDLDYIRVILCKIHVLSAISGLTGWPRPAGRLKRFEVRQALSPKVLEAIGRQFGVAHRMLDVPVPEIGL